MQSLLFSDKINSTESFNNIISMYFRYGCDFLCGFTTEQRNIGRVAVRILTVSAEAYFGVFYE